MSYRSNPFQKSQGEIDFNFETHSRAINSDMGRNSPKEYQIQDEVYEISLMDSDIYPDESNEPGRIFSQKGLKKRRRAALKL